MAENAVLEAKAARAYDLDSAAGQYELAKDVSAFANSQGGHLIFGLITERSASEQVDIIARLEPMAMTDFPSRQIEGLIREYVVPTIAGLSVQWIAHSPPNELGLGIVTVPPQPDDAKPFLTARVVDTHVRLKQIVFGYCRRIGADSLPHDVHQLLKTMRQGMNSTAQRLSAIEAKLNALLESAALTAEVPHSVAEANALLADRIQRIMTE